MSQILKARFQIKDFITCSKMYLHLTKTHNKFQTVLHYSAALFPHSVWKIVLPPSALAILIFQLMLI